MKDIIEGVVVNVVDGDTFDLDIDRIGTQNRYQYSDIERIRVAGIDAPELGTNAGRAAHARLRSQIQGQRVRVEVHARDVWRRVVGSIVAAGASLLRAG